MHKEDAPHRSPPLVDQAFARLRRDVLAGTFGAAIGIALTALLRVVRRRVLSWMPADTSQRTVSA